jgi:AI-2 transport protein TqsA
MNTVASLAATIVILGAMKIAAPVIVPLLLAVCVAIAFLPLSHRLALRGLPPIIAAAVTALTVLGVIALAAVFLVIAGSDLADSLPRYEQQLGSWQASAATWLGAHSMEGPAARVASLRLPDYAGSAMTHGVLAIGGFVSSVGLVLLLTVFIQLESATFPAKLRRALGGRSAADARESMETVVDALGDIQKYLAVKMATSAGKAILVGGWTAAMGLSYPVLWAVLAFALNFLPVLGSIVAALPAVALALLELGPGGAAFVALGIVIVNVWIGSIVEPRVLGRALGLSPLVVVLSVVLWGFVLGPVGALLAVPSTMMLKIMLDHTTELRWLARLLEYRRVPRVAPLPPPLGPGVA